LLMHTEPADEHGTDLPAVIKELCPDYKVMFTPTRLMTQTQLNYLYNMADVTINLASNEGFGLGTAESVMAGTPIIVNVTGGMQDQCGFQKDDGTFITEKDFSDDFQTNADKVYTKHGEWAKPVFPAVRSLQGSIPTPYIFDDMPDWKEAANALKEWHEMSRAERKTAALKGREHYMKPEVGLSAETMGNNFIKDINTMFANWTPRQRAEITKI